MEKRWIVGFAIVGALLGSMVAILVAGLKSDAARPVLLSVSIITAVLFPIVAYLIRTLIDYWVGSRAAERTHRHRLVETMTVKFHEYSEKFYMSSISAARLAAKNMYKEPSYAFFHLAGFIAKWREVSSQMPGLFLRSLGAEELIRELEEILTASIHDIFQPQQVDTLVEMRTNNPRYDDFKLATERNDVSSLQLRFAAWRSTDAGKLFHAHLHTYAETFLFWVNVPYEAWYGEREAAVDLKDKHLEVIGQALTRLAEDNNITDKTKKRLLTIMRKVATAE